MNTQTEPFFFTGLHNAHTSKTVFTSLNKTITWLFF